MPARASRPLYLFALALLIALGTFLRFYPSAAFQGKGFDEAVYEHLALWMQAHSVTSYPAFCDAFLLTQQGMEAAMPPPTRFTYPYLSQLWSSLSGGSIRTGLIQTSAFFGSLTLLVCAAFAHRLGGRAMALGTTALMATAFGQIHQAQHAMIDGYFTFWAMLALWMLWEVLHHPERLWLLLPYTAGLFFMVTTKENAFFTCATLAGLIALAPWLGFGRVTRPLLLATGAAGLAGIATLTLLAGGADTLVEIYRTLVTKGVVHSYAVMNNDGPWHRYLVELMLASPLLLLLATGAAFQVRKADTPVLYLLCFFGISFALMCSVKNGMNFRYTVIWDFPLRYLALVQLIHLARFAGARRALAATLAVALLCTYSLYQYKVFCIDYPSYALTPKEMLRASQILK